MNPIELIVLGQEVSDLLGRVWYLDRDKLQELMRVTENTLREAEELGDRPAEVKIHQETITMLQMLREWANQAHERMNEPAELRVAVAEYQLERARRARA